VYRGQAGGQAACLVLNAANEIAVARFLAGDIGFLDIADLVAATLDAYPARLGPCRLNAIEDILQFDTMARALAQDLAASRHGATASTDAKGLVS